MYILKLVPIAIILFIAGCTEYNAKKELSNKGYGFDSEGIRSAIVNGDVDSVKLFISAKYDLNQAGAASPLSNAITSRQYKIFDLLVENGAKVNSPSINQPLMAAISVCDDEMVKKLIDLGADVNIKNKEGYSAVAIAKNYGISISYKCLKIATTLKNSGGKCEAPAQVMNDSFKLVPSTACD